MNTVNNKNLISTAAVAKLLKISRVAVFKKIKSGELMAEKIGRNYVVDSKDVEDLTNPMVTSSNNKMKIEKALDRTVNEYRETLELLGKQDTAK
jgi:excisionase family DNA binding protein